MDSRLIFSAVTALKSKINWNRVNPYSEWIYVGEGNELKVDLILDEIRNRFGQENIYLVLGRTDSLELTNDSIESEVLPRIEKGNFILCDKRFSIFMEFSGDIMRSGTK